MSPLNPSRMDIEPELSAPAPEPFELAIQRGDFLAAAALCDEQEATAAYRSDPAVRGAVLLARCRLRRVGGEYGAALEAGEEAFRLFRGLGDAAAIARCHNRLGAVHYRIGNADD